MDKMRIYDGEGDRLMADVDAGEKIILVPDTAEAKGPESRPKLRIMWGQYLLEDLLAGRYRTLICGVNAEDNRRGIIAQVAALLPTSQWDHALITAHAKRFVNMTTVSVIKFDMDAVEVLALLRPAGHDCLALEDLALGFQMASEMLRRKPQRLPSASVSFLGGVVNKLRDSDGREPSFETVLRTVYDAGYSGDVYPAPAMWQSAPTEVYARYPFPSSLENMRQGGF